MKRKVGLVIFDLDGTLIDAYTAIQKSINHALNRLGKPPVTVDRVRRAVGMGYESFIASFVRKSEVPIASSLYFHHHKESLRTHSRAITKARAVLSELRRHGYALAVASNRPAALSGILLRHLRLDRYFESVFCAKRKRELKPAPYLLRKAMRSAGVRAEDTVYVGDMVIDVRAGKAAGVRTVAVVGGSSPVSALVKAKPSALVRDLGGALRFILNEAQSKKH